MVVVVVVVLVLVVAAGVVVVVVVVVVVAAKRAPGRPVFSCFFSRFARYLQYFRDGGGRGDDDDIGTQTPRTISPQEPFYSVFTVLSRWRTILYDDGEQTPRFFSGFC